MSPTERELAGGFIKLRQLLLTVWLSQKQGFCAQISQTKDTRYNLKVRALLYYKG